MICETWFLHEHTSEAASATSVISITGILVVLSAPVVRLAERGASVLWEESRNQFSLACNNRWDILIIYIRKLYTYVVPLAHDGTDLLKRKNIQYFSCRSDL